MSDEPARADASLRVLLAADDPLVRAALVLQLTSQPDVLVAGQASLRDDLAQVSVASGADAVLWDAGADATTVGERLEELEPGAVPVAVLLPDDAQVAAALGAGARAVLPRDAEGSALSAALRATAAGLVVLDAGFASGLTPARERGAAARPAEDLTAREREVLQQLAAGLPNKSIAHKLGISDHTVKFHVNAILSKLGAQSRTEAVVRAAQMGLVIL